MHFTIKKKARRNGGGEGASGVDKKGSTERTGLRGTWQAKTRGIATSVINGILSSLHVKLG